MKHLFPRKRAFTLVELLIVITIIGILAVALLPKLTGGTAKARDAQRKADLQQIATALEFYADDNNGLYPGASACVSTISDLGDYLTTVPNDPQDSDSGTCNDGYTYEALEVSGGFASSYLLVSKLESTTANGTGIYGTTFVVDNNASASSNMTTNVGKLCSTLDCSSIGAYYIIGR